MKISKKMLNILSLAAIVVCFYYLSTIPNFHDVYEVTGWWLIERAIGILCIAGLICAIIASIMLYVSTHLHFKKKNNENKHN